MDKDQRRRLREACADGDKMFTAEIVLLLLNALDQADFQIEELEIQIGELDMD
jgi:hypothetical protein